MLVLYQHDTGEPLSFRNPAANSSIVLAGPPGRPGLWLEKSANFARSYLRFPEELDHDLECFMHQQSIYFYVVSLVLAHLVVGKSRFLQYFDLYCGLYLIEELARAA